MKIISTKEYNELKKTQSAYLDLLMKPLQGVFEKVTDDDLLRDNANLYAENKKLHSIIKEVREYIHKNCILSDEWTDLDFCNFIPTGKITYKQLTSKKVKELLEILDKVSK